MSDPGLLKAGFALAFLCVPALAQSSAKKDSPKQDFSKEGAVIEQTVTRVFFESDGTSTREQRTRVRVQSDAGTQQCGVLHFPYEASVERIEILDVRVTKADRSVVATRPDSIQDTPSEVSHEAPFYSARAHKDTVAHIIVAVGCVADRPIVASGIICDRLRRQPIIVVVEAGPVKDSLNK
jgi:ethanolamine ammonia-lyase small subunit